MRWIGALYVLLLAALAAPAWASAPQAGGHDRAASLSAGSGGEGYVFPRDGIGVQLALPARKKHVAPPLWHSGDNDAGLPASEPGGSDLLPVVFAAGPIAPLPPARRSHAPQPRGPPTPA